MFKVEHTTISTAAPYEIWKLYCDVTNWKTWDSGLESSTLGGEFHAGTAGTLTSKGGPALPFTLTEVEPERRFVDQTVLPGATLVFTHELEPTLDGTRITHRIEIIGPDAERYTQMFGDNLRDGLPEAVEGVSRLAELATMATNPA